MNKETITIIDSLSLSLRIPGSPSLRPLPICLHVKSIAQLLQLYTYRNISDHFVFDEQRQQQQQQQHTVSRDDQL